MTSCILNGLCKLLGDLAVPQSDLLLFIAVKHDTASSICISSPVREKSFVYPEKCLLIIDKEIKQHAFVSDCKVTELHPVLGQLGKLKKTLLKISSFFAVLLSSRRKLMKLFIVNVSLQSPFHDVFPHLFNAVDE